MFAANNISTSGGPAILFTVPLLYTTITKAGQVVPAFSLKIINRGLVDGQWSFDGVTWALLPGNGGIVAPDFLISTREGLVTVLVQPIATDLSGVYAYAG